MFETSAQRRSEDSSKYELEPPARAGAYCLAAGAASEGRGGWERLEANEELDLATGAEADVVVHEVEDELCFVEVVDNAVVLGVEGLRVAVPVEGRGERGSTDPQTLEQERCRCPNAAPTIVTRSETETKVASDEARIEAH